MGWQRVRHDWSDWAGIHTTESHIPACHWARVWLKPTIYLKIMHNYAFLESGLGRGQPSLVTQTVKNLPTMQETQVPSLGWEDPLEKGMATHSSIFAWKIPWTEEPGGLQSIGSQRVGHNWVTNTFTFKPFLMVLEPHLMFCESVFMWVAPNLIPT